MMGAELRNLRPGFVAFEGGHVLGWGDTAEEATADGGHAVPASGFALALLDEYGWPLPAGIDLELADESVYVLDES